VDGNYLYRSLVVNGFVRWAIIGSQTIGTNVNVQSPMKDMI